MHACRQLSGLAVIVSIGLWLGVPQALAQDQENAPEPSPVGRWRTIDDKTGEIAAVVEIELQGEELIATIRQVMSPPAESDNPACVKCSGDLKDKPMVGLQIMWGMTRKDDDEFDGGRILDPDNGKTYKCKLKLVEDGSKLEVRGYVGFSLFGRTQTWLRESAAEGGDGSARTR
jgi:uncharacterized protein (DUF2147 family)